MNVTVQQSVAAGASVDLLTNTNAEFVDRDSQVEIALGTTAVGVVATVTSGSNVLQEESPVFVYAAGVPFKYPDDFLLSDVAAAGERLRVRVRNTTAGALTVTATVRTTAV